MGTSELRWVITQIFVVVRTTEHGFDIVGAFADHERAQQEARVAEKWDDTISVVVRSTTLSG